jgi:hypothetical protein
VIIFRVISGTTWTSNPTTHHTRPISQPILFADDPIVSFLTEEYADDDVAPDPQDSPEAATEPQVIVESGNGDLG